MIKVSTIGAAEKPEFVQQCIQSALKSLDADKLGQAIMGTLSSNPELMESLANKALLDKLGLTAQQATDALLNSMKEMEGRPCVCRGLITNQKID